MPYEYQLYTGSRFGVTKRFLVLLSVLAAGCGAAISAEDAREASDRFFARVNEIRASAGVPPLAPDPALARSAEARARHAASQGKASPDDNCLERIVAAGAFARFALSHEVEEASLDEAVRALLDDPLARAKIAHGRITHAGLGLSESNGRVFLVVDLARLAPTADIARVRAALVDEIQKRRSMNSAAPLEFRPDLDQLAEKMARKFMETAASSDDIVAEAQRAVAGESFALGRVTAVFQAVPDPSAVVIPERANDPALAFAGAGLAQGNHPNHEAGSLAVMLFLAEPQTAHETKRAAYDAPPPKAQPAGSLGSKGSLADQAWVATLAGNHRKAATLFEKAYRASKKPALIYEAARAHARDGNLQAALADMKKYAGLVEGADRDRALDLVSRLEKGESIFKASEEEKMSVEAKRFFAIGERLFREGEWDGAIDAFQQAYAYAKHPDIVYNIGLAHCRAGRVGEALAFFAEYQRYVPEAKSADQARQMFEIGVALYAAGQFENAARQFALAYAFLPTPEVVYNLALCHRAMGDRGQAVRFLREYIDAGPPEKERAEAARMIEEMEKP